MSQVNQFVQQLIQFLKRRGGGRNPRAYNQGLTPYRQKQWQQAVECFTQAAAEQPGHAPSYFKLGMSHFRLKEYDAASGAIKRALELDPNQKQWQDQLDQVARYVVKLSYKTPTEKEQAIRDQIECLDNPSATLYNELAHALRKQTKWAQEVESLEIAVEKDANQPTWFYRLGEALEVIGSFSQAAIAYQNAIELKGDKTSANWFYRLGYTCEMIEKQSLTEPEKSQYAYQQAINADKKLNAKRFGIGVFHQQRGLWYQAKEAYCAKKYGCVWDAELYYRLGLMHGRCSKWNEAEVFLKNALTIDITQTKFHFALGVALEKLEKYDEAALAYKYAALHCQNHNPYWFQKWSLMLAKLGDYEQASYTGVYTRQSYAVYDEPNTYKFLTPEPTSICFSFDNYINQFENNEFIRSSIDNLLKKEDKEARDYYQIGTIYERERCWKLSAEFYQKAIEMHKGVVNEEWRYRLGFVSVKNNEHYKACQFFNSINHLMYLESRINKEIDIEVTSIYFSENEYLFNFNVKNSSKINKEIEILGVVIKHRERVGNEVDEFHLHVDINYRSTNQSVITGVFKFNENSLNLDLHYWDLFVDITIFDDVYNFVTVRLPMVNFSPDVLRELTNHPWEYSTFNDEYVFHPYITVGGGKVAFLKRPKSIYDDSVYIEREKQAVTEYEESKDELDSQKAWLIFEKFSKTAQDNGFYFFKYAVNRRPHVYYVIEKGSPDLKYLEAYKENVVEFMSVKHMKLLLSCEKIISSEGRGHGYAWRRINGLFKKNLLEKEYTFLQHGVIGMKKLGNDFSKNNKNFAADFFLSSTEIEREIISKEFNYDSSNIISAGLPRWAGLKDQSFQYDEIFLMPSWRNWLEDISTAEFVQTEYFKTYKKLLTSSKLIEVLEENSLVLNFYLHPKVIGLLHSFIDDNPRINFVDFGEVTVRELLQRSKLLITDYSSVAWDFIYLEKPVAFYHFDIDKYENLQGAYLDLKGNFLGKSHYHEKSLISGIADIIKNYSYYKELAVAIKEDCLYYQPENINEHIYQKLITHDKV